MPLLEHLSSLGLWIVVLDWSLRLLVVARVVLRRCPVPMSLSWILTLLLMPIPFLGFFMYFLIGESRLGQRRARTISELTASIEQRTIPYLQGRVQGWDVHDTTFNHMSRLCTAVGGMPPLGGNRLDLMGSATEVLDRLIADIDAATHHCHLLYYIWMPASRGLAVAQALMRASKRGVACRVLVDAVGSRPFFNSELPDQLRAAGVRVAEALPVNPVRFLFARLDLRNHRKIAVIDGTTAYCGSQNLTDETFRNKRRKKIGPWIDATVRVQGPAAQALQTIFLADWAINTDENHPDLNEKLDEFFPRLPEITGTIDAASRNAVHGSIVHVVPSGPGPQPDAIHQALLLMIFAASEEIILTTPYFVPDEATKNALINAAVRGVDVTIIVPDHLDGKVVAAASRAHYEDLLVAGVKIFEHTDGLLHAKTASIDRRLAFVSSVNFDMRSFWLNFEATLFVYDDDFASVLRFMQQGYRADSVPIDLNRWRQRPIYRRFIDNAAQLLSPLL